MKTQRHRERGPAGRVLRFLPAIRAVVLPLVLASTAAADPRWWWDDAPVGSVGTVTDVDVAVIDEPGLPLVIFLAWVNPPTLIEGRLLLTASFDGGCSFCPPVHVQSLFGPDDDIALAATALDGVVPTASVALVHAAAGRVQVLHEAGSIPLTGAADCRSLQDLSLALSRTPLADGDADQPDIAGIADLATGTTQFHAVWHQIAPTDEEWIVHARDLAGDGSGWEVLGPLPTSAGLFARQAGPQVSLDLFASLDAAVNVAWAVPEFNQVLSLRSADSGTTFSATGEPPSGPPAVVAQAGLGIAGPLALDSGSSSESSYSPWHGVALFQDRGPAALVVFDAQHQQTPTVPGPEWDVEQVVSTGGAFREDGLAASVLPGGPAGEPQPAWMFWTGAASASGREIFARGGVLDSDAATPVDLDAPAIPPLRPGDPPVSTSGQLTHCLVDPVTFDCVSDRLIGLARRPASADGQGEVFVTWLDDRDGSASVWFKRTDRSVEAPQPALSVSCPAPDERRITVTFDQLPGCSSIPPVAERMRRYLVYYGQTAGGPYENTDLDGSDPGVPDTIVVIDDGTLVDPVTVDIDGLTAGLLYHVIVVPEDEARNVFPADFDPLAARAASPANETSIVTPVVCGPCPMLTWTEELVATPGHCAIDLTWAPASGAAPIVYDVLRDGMVVATGLSATSWSDLGLAWGELHEYSVVARDSCADPGPQEITSTTTPQVAAGDLFPPVVAPALALVSPCEVRVSSVITDDCSGPASLVDILRDGLPVATGVPLPHVDTVPGNGDYNYEVRAWDEAGNETLAPAGSLRVSNCEVPGPCLYRATAPTLDASGLFVSPRGANDIAFASPGDLPYGPCPFASGDTDPETVIGAAAPPLIFYQVEGAGLELHVTAEPALGTVRLTY